MVKKDKAVPGAILELVKLTRKLQHFDPRPISFQRNDGSTVSADPKDAEVWNKRPARPDDVVNIGDRFEVIRKPFKNNGVTLINLRRVSDGCDLITFWVNVYQCMKPAV